MNEDSLQTLSEVLDGQRFTKNENEIESKLQPGTPFFGEQTKATLKAESPRFEELKQKISELQHNPNATFAPIDLDQAQTLWLYTNLGQNSNLSQAAAQRYTQWVDITINSDQLGHSTYVGKRIIQLHPRLYLVLEYGEHSQQVPSAGNWMKRFFEPENSSKYVVPTLEPVKGQIINERPSTKVKPIEDIIMRPVKDLGKPPSKPINPFENEPTANQVKASVEDTQYNPLPQPE